MSSILRQVRRDFLAGSRLPELAALLRQATSVGYRITPVDRWVDEVHAMPSTPTATASSPSPSTSRPSSPRSPLVMRVDIDTDPACALAIADLVDPLNGKASFYFRLTTWDAEVIRQLAGRGHHVDYHFEELASHALAIRATDAASVMNTIAQAREDFVRHVSRLRSESGLPLDLPCSHGDWIDRKLGIDNRDLLADAAFRARAGVRHEVNDTIINHAFGDRMVDGLPAHLDGSGKLQRLLAHADGPARLILHPRDWRSNPSANLTELGKRLRTVARTKRPRSM